MNKKIFFLLLFIFIFRQSCFAEPIIYINNNEYHAKVQPFIENGRIMMPMREMFELFNSEVEWMNEEKLIIAARGDTIISLKPGNNRLLKTYAENGETEVILLDTPPKILNDITYVPLRAVAESFCATVNWDSATEKVDITFENM